VVLDIQDDTTTLFAPSVKQCMDDILNVGELFHEYYFLAYQNTLFSYALIILCSSFIFKTRFSIFTHSKFYQKNLQC
jgi:hypothetical protein